jgi:xylan 1,4-beta-xylosidase
MNFRNTEYYASYIATSYHHIDRLSREMQIDVRPLAWAFLFIGERCFEGTRTFSTQGIPKASFNMFKLYARLGQQRPACECLPDSSIPGDLPEVLGMAAQSEDGSIQVMLSSYHDDWDVDVPCAVELSVEHLPFDGPVVVEHSRIDADHSNAYAEWVRQRKPNYPDPQQYEAIKARSYIESLEPIRMLPVVGEKILLTFTLPAHAISLIEISPAAV